MVGDKRKDPDNLVDGATKCLLDGLQLAGVIPRDGWAWVRGVGGYARMSKLFPGVLCVAHDTLVSFELMDALWCSKMNIPF